MQFTVAPSSSKGVQHRLGPRSLPCAARPRPLPVSLPLSHTASVRARDLVVPCAVKKWVKPDINPKTGKAVRTDMHVREGDTVKVIAGKDKGKVGEVVKVYRKGLKAGKILVDDVNLVKKALKPKAGSEEEKGKIILTEKPIHHSNVMLYSTAKQQVSRVGHKVVDGKKLRYLVKTGEVLQERPIVKKVKEEPSSDAGDE